MRVQGRLKDIQVDGYERLLRLQTPEMELCCSQAQADEYLERNEQSRYLTVGAFVSLDLELSLVLKWEKANPNDPVGIYQDRVDSPSTEVVGVVKARTSSTIYDLDVGACGEVSAQFEEPVELVAGDRVRVRGELAAAGL